MSVGTADDRLTIRSGQGDYVVEFHGRIEDVVSSLRARRETVLVIDQEIARLYPMFGQLGLPTLELEATEETKTLDGVGRLVAFLQANACNRTSSVLAIGGGIIQDVVTFTTHVYFRGIRFTLVPTTLLSQCDSSIGAKCGINFGAYKNQLGVFHSPSAVVICDAFLNTLSDEDIASGYGEILKLLLTGPRDGFDRLERALAAGGFRNAELLSLIRASLAVKQRIIEEDEYESRLRMVLNYGHTYGHALEAVTANEVPHGIGVAWGIDVANAISEARGLLDHGMRQRIADLRKRYFPVRTSREVTADALIAAARTDKKVGAGGVTMALLREPGRIDLVPVPFDAALQRILEEFLAKPDAVLRA